MADTSGHTQTMRVFTVSGNTVSIICQWRTLLLRILPTQDHACQSYQLAGYHTVSQCRVFSKYGCGFL